ncbi:MAG: nucleoside-diphosphate sugar epimerase/dehydratase [Bacillota bacterium]
MFKYIRFALLLIIDIIIINIALFGALVIRFEGIASIPPHYLDSFFKLTPIFTMVRLGCFYAFGLYKRMWQYASIGELVSIIYAVSAGTIINVSLAYFIIEAGRLPLPRSVFVLSWMLNILLIGGSRLAWRLFRDEYFRFGSDNGGRSVLIVGAGETGVLLVKELRRHYKGSLNIVGFVDDDPLKQDLKVLGVPILGDRHMIYKLVEKHEIKEIIIAIPSASGKVIREIVDVCHETDAEVKILPGVYDLIEGNITVSHIREVQVEDLLGREPVKVNLDEISQYLNNQVIMITGAGGSIGSELCRQIINFSPKRLLLLDNCENNIYDIDMELRRTNLYVEIIPLIKDVRDRHAIEMVFQRYKPKVVFHAAAHKHVPLMELNPEEAIKNNVMGTYNAAYAADKSKAERFVLISTDKAVNPTSIMGATKRVAEMIVQQMDKTSNTCFAAVRFGNVLGSKGSVVPLFKKQIAEGGPVTVTHEDMVRYFMTIPEAVQLVIQAGAMARGGEIFILDMGEPVKIMDLAKTLIRLSGCEPGKDIDIVISGIRPGEKLFEELLTAEEGVNATVHKKIFVAKPNDLDEKLIEEIIMDMHRGLIPDNEEKTVMLLKKFFVDFKGEQAVKMIG